MALSTYADLQTAVAGWLHRTDLTSIIPDLILIAEKRIWRDVRCRQMETALNVSIASGVAAVPNDYLDIKFAYVDSSPATKLTRCSASNIYEQYPTRTGSGIPKLIAREGSNFIFGPYPGSGYTLKGIYYAQLTSIQSTANALFTKYPDLYLFASLAEAASYIKDQEAIQHWNEKFQAVKEMIRLYENNEYGSGGGLQVVAA